MKRGNRKTQQGFTLIELLVVVVIIGILASVAIPNFMGAQDKAKNAGVQANVHNVQMALEQYAVDNAGVYPSSSANLSNTVVADKGYMAGGTWPKTPWGSQQSAGIDFAVASESDAIGTVYGPGVEAAPTTVSDYGSVAYNIASGATANEKYDLAGYGKHNGNYSLVMFLKNY